ncbi:MAG: hypothetical protein IKZ46_12045 [Victivallales bacterium]|nr:hypothetical protein [Victivallales bacterium]
MQKTKKDRQNERGSALLLVLGILSLVLVLGMSFVFTARTERQVAQANSSQMSAKLIAQSALNRVVSDMGYYFRDDDDKPLVYPSVELTDDTEQITFGLQKAPGSDKGIQLCAVSKNLHIGDIEDDEQDHFNDLLKLEIFDDTDKNVYESLPQLTLLEKVSGKETFTQPITVKYKNADDKTCTDVIGRYGYVILEEGSKIDVNSALSFSGKVPFAPKDGKIFSNGESKDLMKDYGRIGSPYEEDKDTDYVFSITDDETEDDIQNGSNGEENVEGKNTFRRGWSMEEVQLKKDFWDKLPEGSSKLKKSPWMSYAHLSNALGKKDFTKESFNYTFFSGEDIEAFWDADAKKERSRFDLTGFTASEKTEDTATYDERMDENFWELADKDNLQEDVKKKMDVLTGAASDGSSKRAEFWKELTDGDLAVYFDGKDGGFWYKVSDGGTVTKETDTEKYGGIPWLDKMKDDDGNSVSDQVAANLIDFSDKDNIASTDFKLELGDDGFWDEPTYCGNERVPYINEIDLKVEMTRDADITATGDTYSFKMNVKAMAELVNIYCNDDGTGSDCDAVPDDLHVQVRVIGQFTVTEVKYAFDLDPASGQNVLMEKERKTKTYPMGGDDGYLSLTSGNKIPRFHLGYQVIELNGQVFPQEGLTDTDFPQPVSLQTAGFDEVKYFFSYSITQVLAVVYEGSTLKNDTLCDVAFFPHETYYELPDTDPYSPLTNSFTGPYIVTMQANDPRCNMIAKRKDATSWNDKLWKIEKYDAETGTEPENTLGDDEKGRDNSNFKTEVDNLDDKQDGMDWEHDVTFESSNTRSFSTAFIRNAPMETLWELGAIHRGAPYQTINLKKFTEPKEASGKYEDGDAAILDYVKIGPLRFAKGRVNANTRNLGAIDLLLKDIAEETYDGEDLPSGDSVKWNLTIDDDDLADTDKYKTSYNRGVMANLLFDMLDDDVKTDRDAEALIGKTAGLLTTRLDTYSVYIVAEALREMRDIPDDTTFEAIKDTLINPIKVTHVIRADEDYNDSTSTYRAAGKKDSYCSIVGTQRMLVQLIRDAWRNEIKVERVQYLEK